MSIDWKFIDALLNTLPSNIYSPITFLIPKHCFEDISKQIVAKVYRKHINLQDFNNLHTIDLDDAVILLKISTEQYQLLADQDTLYSSLGNLIESNKTIIAIIQKETLEQKVEGRIKALLFRGVTEEIYES